MENTKTPIHLVFSSGGVRCFSYLGAITELLKQGAEIKSISGCSMGSFIGALVSSGMEIDDIKQAFYDFDLKSLKQKRNIFAQINFLKYPFSLYKDIDYESSLKTILKKDPTLKELKIPFAAASLDIVQSRLLTYSSQTHGDMKLSEVLKIATAVPTMSKPFEVGNRVLVDAAIASESPVWIAASNSENYPIVVLKTRKPKGEYFKKNISSFLEHLYSSSAMSHDYFISSQLERVFSIEIDCGDIVATDFKITQEQKKLIVKYGSETVEQKFPDIRKDFGNTLYVEDLNKVNKIEEQPGNEDKAQALSDVTINKFFDKIVRRDQLFVSYARKNKDWLEKFQSHLGYIQKFTGIKIWDDSNISAGDEWKTEIEDALKVSKVALFLVTPEFLNSKFIQEEEMPYFLEVSKKENVTILWVAVSHIVLEATPFAAIQCANDVTKPLASLADDELQKTLITICELIIEKMES